MALPSQAPLKLLWWRSLKGTPNLGDELGPLLLSRLFGLKVQAQGLGGCEAISVGSILSWAIDGGTKIGRKLTLHVLGSGFMHGNGSASPPFELQAHFLRGALSYARLNPGGTAPVCMGDLGLLCGELPLPRGRARHSVVLIPHHSRMHSLPLRRFVEAIPGAVMLDMRTDDLDAVMATLAGARLVVSQSLHGLVMADALGVPNVWLNNEALHEGGIFKFLDYFSSIGRPAYLRIEQLNHPRVLAELDGQAFELSRRHYLSVCEQIHLGMDRFLAARQPQQRNIALGAVSPPPAAPLSDEAGAESTPALVDPPPAAACAPDPAPPSH